MGDHTVDKKLKSALSARDAFRSDRALAEKVSRYSALANGKEKIKLGYWKTFFSKYQIPITVLDIKKKIDALESKILDKKAKRKEGYALPGSGKFVNASEVKMSLMIRTEKEEKTRKAAFYGREKLAPMFVDEYVKLVALKNKFAKKLGYGDYYAYKLDTEEGMTKDDLFSIFDRIYNKTKFAFKNVRALEKKIPHLRKPWNFVYTMTGDFSHEADQYFPFDDALLRWGKSFASIGIDYQGGSLQLDLLDRKGKYSNGFCHYPKLVYERDGKLEKASSNFTCNVTYGQIGAGIQGMATLFHEGGHAADRLNSKVSESCMNTEYPPSSTAWAETQSMFLDTMFSSLEWKRRYAKNKKGEAYPLDLFIRILEKTHVLNPLGMMPFMFVMYFEKEVYEAKNLTSKQVLLIAKRMFKKYFDRTADSLTILNIPHIYSWESSCSYHGYALAQLALNQWREYFYEKYGYIVDNPNVGKEMKKVWSLGSTKTFLDFVKIATGKKLSPKPYLDVITASKKKIIEKAKKRHKAMEKVKKSAKHINLNASIAVVHGKEVIADNKRGFENMAKKYSLWLNKK